MMDFPHASRRGNIYFRQIITDYINAGKDNPATAQFRPDLRGNLEITLGQRGRFRRATNMHIGARIAIGGYSVQRANRLAFDQNHPLVASPHLRQILLGNHRLAAGCQKHFRHRAEIFIARRQPKNASAAIAEKRFQNNVAKLGAKIRQRRRIAGNQGGRQQPVKQGWENLFRRITHRRRVIDHQCLRVNTLQQMRGGNIMHVKGRVLAHQHHIHC